MTYTECPHCHREELVEAKYAPEYTKGIQYATHFCENCKDVFVIGARRFEVYKSASENHVLFAFHGENISESFALNHSEALALAKKIMLALELKGYKEK